MMAIEPVVDSNKEYKRKQAAMLRRVKSLGMDNPLVKGVVEEKKKEEKREDTYTKWQPVERLVREAYDQYLENELSFERVVVYLAGALFKLVGKNAKK